MARREITQFYDDLDNQLIGEDELEVVRFSVNGRSYLMDLSRDNARRGKIPQNIIDAYNAAH
ncbi:Lsr2 dimerization domain-containing protein [Corynebacterium segmentosum]